MFIHTKKPVTQTECGLAGYCELGEEEKDGKGEPEKRKGNQMGDHIAYCCHFQPPKGRPGSRGDISLQLCNGPSAVDKCCGEQLG